MELVNFVGANPSQDGKWLLVTFVRKGSDEKFRWIMPLEAVGKLVVACKEDDRYKISLPVFKKKEEPKEAQKEEHEPLEEEIPF